MKTKARSSQPPADAAPGSELRPGANQAVVHANVPLIEVADARLLDDLYADDRAARCLLVRLSGTVAVVAPGTFGELYERLRKLGHTPKVLSGE
jgi:hypothetical protein